MILAKEAKEQTEKAIVEINRLRVEDQLNLIHTNILQAIKNGKYSLGLEDGFVFEPEVKEFLQSCGYKIETIFLCDVYVTAISWGQ